MINDVVRVGQFSGNLKRFLPSAALLARMSPGSLGRKFDFSRGRR
jgi:hypothetical protein